MPDAAELPSTTVPRPATELERQLERYLRHLSIERGLSGNSVAAYRRDLTALLGRLESRGIVDPGAVTAADLGDHTRALREGERPLAASSLARVISSIRGYFRFLLDDGVIETDPLTELIAPKLPRRLPKALTIDQVERLLAATEGDDPVRLRDRALLELLYATGARVTEIVSLNVDDLLGDEGAVDVVRVLGKGGKQRIIPVGSYARAAIDAYLVRSRPLLSVRGRATPAVFLGARGARLSRQNAWLIIRAAGERAELGLELSPHSLRHSFATHLLAGGADVRVVQELLGHSNVATTQLYTLVTADTLRDAYLAAHPRSR